MTIYNMVLLKDGIKNLMPLLGEYSVEHPVIDLDLHCQLSINDIIEYLDKIRLNCENDTGGI